MTIIRPSLYVQNKRFIILLITVVLVFGILYIYNYNRLASLRFQESQIKSQLEKLTAEQNELKNKLFTITDPRKFEDLAKKYNLVLEIKPDYFVLYKWLSEQTF